MGVAEALIAFIIVGLPVLGIFFLVGRLLRHREKRMEIDAHAAAARTGQHSEREERLEQRVRVLERIVTDKGLGVADEIERLRDERPVN